MLFGCFPRERQSFSTVILRKLSSSHYFKKKANISHLTCFNLLMQKKAKLYNISRSLQASNKKLPLSAFNFVDAASSDAFCLLSSNKVKLFNICCPARATNAKPFPSFFLQGCMDVGYTLQIVRVQTRVSYNFVPTWNGTNRRLSICHCLNLWLWFRTP